MDAPLHIVLLDSWKRASFEGSGTAAGIRNLALALRLLGHEVDLITPEGDAASLAHRITFNLGIPSRLRFEERLDLVVGFDFDGFRWASARDRRIPYVVALKGIAADEARFSRSAPERWLLSGLGVLERWNARRADRVLVPSLYSARIAGERYGVPESKIGVVPEAIDLRMWKELRSALSHAREPESGDGGRTILSVARQYPRKDTATLLMAMPRVLAARPGVRLAVVGGGPELRRLRKLGERLGLGDAVIWHGEVRDDEDVRKSFFEADVFCLPSLQEGFGIVFAEAMAAGLPVVAARAGAAPEVIEDGVTGILVPPGDHVAVSEALIQLLDDSDARGRMGSAGSRHAERYDLESVGRRFLDEVRPLLARNVESEDRDAGNSRTPLRRSTPS
jgi:phosphatidylinositol alpha-1,6-mannosyltransferase